MLDDRAIRSKAVRASLAAVAAVVASPAFAHHPTGGKTPGTLMEGLLSGLGHPVIGLDHLFAILGVGILAAAVRAPWRSVFAFVGAMIAGVVLHVASFDLPRAELLVALSTGLIGVLIATRMTTGILPVAMVFAAAGLVHGYALGESIIGAEPTPLYAYLAGLAAVQSTIALAAFAAVQSANMAAPASRAITAAGLAIAAVGFGFAATAAGLTG